MYYQQIKRIQDEEHFLSVIANNRYSRNPLKLTRKNPASSSSIYNNFLSFKFNLARFKKDIF